MNGIALKSDRKKKLRKASRWRTHQQRKRHRYESQLPEEERWTRKPNATYVFITHESICDENIVFWEDDIIAVHGNVSEEGKPRTGHISVLQIKAADYLKFSEIGLKASSDVLKHYQKAVEDLRSHLAGSMPVFEIPRVTFQARDIHLPIVKQFVPDLLSNVKFDTGFFQRLLRDSFASSWPEGGSSMKHSVELQWLDDPASLLDRLESGELSESEQRMAIAHAESVAFPESQRERLLTAYDGLIEESRYTEDDEEITTICSAIRKYAMNMDSDRLSRYAGWFVPSASERVHHDVELELTKGAYWHLRYVNTTPDESLRGLQTVLADEACDYLKSRLMLDKNYASIAKFAILACLLIDARLGESEVSDRVWSQKQSLSMSWFDRLVRFELGKAVNSIDKRDADFAVKVRELLDTLDREGE